MKEREAMNILSGPLHDSPGRSFDFWHDIRNQNKEILKDQNRAARDRLEEDDTEMRYHDIVAIISEWLDRDLSNEVKWLGLEEVILETSKAEDVRCFEYAIEQGYYFLQSQNWLNTPGPWTEIRKWIPPGELSNLARARLANMVGTFVVIDCETTGLNPLQDRIIKLDFAQFVLGLPIATASVYVNPGEGLSEEVVKITGVSELHVRAAHDFHTAAEWILSWANTSLVVVHASDFVEKFIKAECERCGGDFSPLCLCSTYQLAKETQFSGKKDLRCLAGRFGIFDPSEVILTGRLLPALLAGE